jgi:hypothetical protein
LNILQGSLPPNHPHVRGLKENIQIVKTRLWMIFLYFFENKKFETEGIILWMVMKHAHAYRKTHFPDGHTNRTMPTD